MKTTVLSIAALAVASPAFADGHGMMGYCENSFFAGDQNADGMIDSTEASIARDAIYQELDLNADGAIDRSEYVACTEKAAATAPLDREMAQDDTVFGTLDADASGSIEPKEFFDRAFKAYEDVFVNLNNTETGWHKPFIAMPDGMTSADLSGMSNDEFAARAARTYASSDADLDGTLSRDEWLARAETYEIDIEAVNGKFDAMDANADGMVSRDEYDATLDADIELAESKADRDGFTDQSKGIPAYYFYVEAM